MNAITISRRTFLKLCVVTASSALAHKAGIAAPAQPTIRPGWDLLPTHPCHEIIHQASDASLLEWWMKYGAGSIAWQYRDVPRRHILYVLNSRGIIPPEHV